MAVPVLSSIQAKLEGRLKVVKIDTEKYPNIASRYQIQV